MCSKPTAAREPRPSTGRSSLFAWRSTSTRQTIGPPSSIVTDSVAAISVGIVDGEERLDLEYVEDRDADVDMNLVMTGGGRFIEVQGAGEEATFSADQLLRLIAVGTEGIAEVTRLQRPPSAMRGQLRSDAGDHSLSRPALFTISFPTPIRPEPCPSCLFRLVLPRFPRHCIRTVRQGRPHRRPDQLAVAGRREEAIPAAARLRSPTRCQRAGHHEADAMAFDLKGRLWVCVSQEYPFPAIGRKGKDRVMVLSDFDAERQGDGRSRPLPRI